jgi:succinyl-CoA synthetase beta subunit
MFRSALKTLKKADFLYKGKRFFELHEYQSKDLMRKYNVRVQKGDIALNPKDAAAVAAKLDPAGGLILKA